VRHQFTHRTLTLHVFRASVQPGRVARDVYDAHRWVTRAGFAHLGLSAVARKALALERTAPSRRGGSPRAAALALADGI
jgi:adenine-specific DNA glycosylase